MGWKEEKCETITRLHEPQPNISIAWLNEHAPFTSRVMAHFPVVNGNFFPGRSVGFLAGIHDIGLHMAHRMNMMFCPWCDATNLPARVYPVKVEQLFSFSLDNTETVMV
jgi:hypothetical protein